VLALVAIHFIFTHIGNAFPLFGNDSLWSLVLVYSGGIAMHIWIIKGFYETIPAEIEEAAKVDGATPWQAFYMVLLPMALPILMVVFLLAFIGSIIEYPVASILLHSQRNLTLAVGANSFLYPQKYMWGHFAAAAILSGLPITIVFMLSQKGLIAGLTSGGTKG
jgi:maltose/maltodextrin transport system permease protein